MNLNQSGKLNKLLITILRTAIGWHFIYEGLSKIMQANWSASSYLLNTSGTFSGFYHFIASSPTILAISDLLNMYGLLLIGLGLFLGVFNRLASYSAVVLLTLYYFAYPPFGMQLHNSSGGHLFIVDKILIEAVALLFLSFYHEKGYGIHFIISKFRIKKNPEIISEPGADNSRREALKNLATIPVLGAMGWGAISHIKSSGVDVMSGATIQVNKLALGELNGTLPIGKIGKHEISRLVAGGNLIGGWAHSRDLIYVSTLFKAYNTEQKVYETLILAEEAGINTINIGFPSNQLLAKYKKITGSKIKVISQVGPNIDYKNIKEVGQHTNENLYYDNINKAIDFGADIIQVQGNWCDWLVRDNKLEVVQKMLENIRSQGYTAGLASHSVESLIICKENGIIPDYYMKTMHHDNYWSAHPVENRVPFEVDGKRHLDHNRFHDNMFCLTPQKTIDFVNNTDVPVMGFKVLAAGAIEPKDGFKWAFDNGADFICVGMFDFQIVNNVNIAIDCINKTNRTRQWFG